MYHIPLPKIISNSALGGVPRPACTVKVFLLFSQWDVKILNYGGFWRDTLAGRGPKDFDLLISWKDWQKIPYAWKKQNLRRQGGHLKYLRKLKEEQGPAFSLRSAPRPLIYRSNPALKAALGIDLNIVVNMAELNVRELLEDIDLGFCQVIDDGKTLLTSPVFWKDLRQETMTLTRCRNPYELGRTLKRIHGFCGTPASRYYGWTAIIPKQVLEMFPAIRYV